MSLRNGLLLLVALLAAAVTSLATRAAEPPTNVIEELQARLDRGEIALDYTGDGWGYLAALTRQLGLPHDSQVLVFSRTSLQHDAIGPKTPRAIYFRDDISLGTVPHGAVIEIIAHDSKSGLAFYTLDTAKAAHPRFERQTNECFNCHAFVNRWALGMIVANVTPTPDGEPLILQVDRLFDLSDSRTPFEQRWGGWYIGGLTGAMRHRGNVTIPDAGYPEAMPPTEGLNITDLSDRFDTAHYLEPSSDVVALMTLEHQTGFVNLVLMLDAQYRSRDLPDAKPRATDADIARTVSELVAYMTFADEAPLPSPVTGVSAFTKTFPANGPRDGKGRSLREFDLKTRMFRYPLSYMIYSENFAALNPAVKAMVWRKLHDVLDGDDRDPRYAVLAARARADAMQILSDTMPGLPGYWPRGVLNR